MAMITIRKREGKSNRPADARKKGDVSVWVRFRILINFPKATEAVYIVFSNSKLLEQIMESMLLCMQEVP